MRRICLLPLLLALLTVSVAAQSLYPPGCKPHSLALGFVELPLLRAQVSYTGGLFGLEAKGIDNQWYRITPDPALAPQSACIDHGSCQLIAVASTPNTPERRFVHKNGSNPEIAAGGIYTANPQTWTAYDFVEQVQPDDAWGRIQFDAAGAWHCEWEGRDSLQSRGSLPLVCGSTTLQQSENYGIWRLTTTDVLSRTSAQPRWTFDHFNVPWMTLDTALCDQLQVDGVTRLVPADIPDGTAPLLLGVNTRTAWIRLKPPISRWLVIRWDQGQQLRTWVHTPHNWIVTPIHRGPDVLLSPTETLTLRYSIEIR